MTHILALDRVCGSCEPARGRLASCPRSGRRPAIQHSELPLSKHEGKREIQISIVLSSIFDLAAVPYSHFATSSGVGNRVLGMVARSCLASPTHTCSSKANAQKIEAVSDADEFSTSSDSQPPRRKRRSRDHRPRKRGDEQRSKGGGWTMWQRQIKSYP